MGSGYGSYIYISLSLSLSFFRGLMQVEMYKTLENEAETLFSVSDAKGLEFPV